MFNPIATPSSSSRGIPPTLTSRLYLLSTLGRFVPTFLALFFAELGQTSGSAAPGQAEAAAGTGTITGRVKNVATGQYLNNARVLLQGTPLVAFTDESGTFHLAGVPVGVRKLDVYYTALDEQTVTVIVAENQTVQRDVNLTSATRYGKTDDVVKIDPFVVAVSRDTDAASIAINEQRFAPNIKNVISTDALGDANSSTAGDFFKFLPGVTTTMSGLEPGGAVIRGLPSNYSVVQQDGVQITAVSFGGGRDFATNQIGVNNISRVEVTKVPLPSTPSDTMSGSINMVSKSAFERVGAELKYRVGVTTDDARFSLHQTPDISNKTSYKIYPNVELDYTQPLGKNLGFVITATTSQISTWISPQIFTDYISNPTTAPNTGASPTNPYLWRFRNLDVTNTYERAALSAKLDWRATEHSVISVSAQASYYNNWTANQQLNPTAGQQGTSTIAGGSNLSYTPTQTLGATGRGSVPMASSFLYFTNLSQNAGLSYTLDDGIWKIHSSFNANFSKVARRDIGKGFFNALGVGLNNPVRVNFLDISEGRPNTFQVFDNNNIPIDIFDINNYSLTTVSKAANTDVRNGLNTGTLDITRKFALWNIPTTLQMGGLYRVFTINDVRVNAASYNYNGINGSRSAAPYLANVYYGTHKLPAFPNLPYPPWVSNYAVYQAFERTPSLFTQTVAQQRATLVGNYQNSKNFREEVPAAYLQGSMRLFDNRLNLVTGVRFEGTKDVGQGPLTNLDGVYQRNADGTFVRNSTGARVRLPAAGAAGSLEEVPFIYTQRGVKSIKSYSGYYPSLHLTYNVRDNLLVRAAYAKTYGRPNLVNLIPNNSVAEDANNTDLRKTGTISYTNPNLKPWTADNYDLGIEYYTKTGGVISGNVFAKDIKNFFGSSTVIANAAQLTAVGLDPVQFLDWTLTTQFNAGTARVQGAEVSFSNSLAMLGPWGRHVLLFVNGTSLRLEGNQSANFSGFLPKSAAWGVTLNYGRANCTLRWTYRGEQKTSQFPDYGPNAYQYNEPYTRLDLSLSYRVTKRMTIYTSILNAGNPPKYINARQADTPLYGSFYFRERSNRIMTAGVKGAF